MKKYFSPIYISLFLVFVLLPHTVLAQPENFSELLQIFLYILGMALMLLYVGAVLVFVRGIIVFILNTDDEAKRKEGKQWMLWAVVAFFVGITLWGLVGILTGTFDLTPLVIPQLPEG